MKIHRHPVWLSLGLIMLFPLLSILVSLALQSWGSPLSSAGEYLPQLLAELVILAVMVLLSRLLGMQQIYRFGHQGLGRCLLPALPIFIIYTFAMLEIVILSSGQLLQPPLHIVWFVLCMLAVGLTEELIFRGLIARMIYERYCHSAVGVWLSVLLSSLLFGSVHIINAIDGQAALGSVLIQMVGATALGMCLAAIYLRTKSLWTVALLHGYMDFCALLPSGLYTAATMRDSIGSYSAANLLSVLLYGALALFLLRPSQIKHLIRSQREPTQNEIMGLMAAVFLIAGLASAVTALSL